MGENAASAANRAIVAERRQRRRGILAPDPGGRRLTLPPSVMETPPTVDAPTLSTNPVHASAVTAASAITNSVRVLWNSGVFRCLGANMAVAGGSFPDNQSGRPNSITHPTPGYNVRIEFEFDGEEFEIATKALATNMTYQYRLWIDGQPATAEAQGFTGNAGSQYLMRVDFGSRAQRVIQIDARYMQFEGLRIGPSDTVWYPSSPVGPRVIGFGDSYIEGSNAHGAWAGLFPKACELLGWRDVWISGVGGTGYVSEGGGKLNFPHRVSADVVAWSPDIVIVWGGYNDVNASTSASAIGAASAETFASIMAMSPKPVLIVVGNVWVSGSPAALSMQARDAIRTAALDAGADLFIDPLGGPIPYSGSTSDYVNTGWLTGLGNAASPTGSGNADYYKTSAGDIHLTHAGHDNHARRLASAIASGLGL